MASETLRDQLRASVALGDEAVTENVYTALAAAQVEMSAPIKGSVNPAFRSKYADLADVVTAVAPALSAHGIAFYHYIPIENAHVMVTALVHGKTESRIECAVPLLVSKQDMHGFKSATTYAKRIGLESVTGVAPEDDDGNAAAKNPPARSRTISREPDAVVHGNDNPATGDRFYREAAPDTGEPVYDGNGGDGGIIRQTWEEIVLSQLPPNANPRQKAEAYAEQLIAEFKKYKSLRGLEGAWTKYEKIIDRLRAHYSDLYSNLYDVYDREERKFKDADSPVSGEMEVNRSVARNPPIVLGEQLVP
jgi:hypothetical protein